MGETAMFALNPPNRFAHSSTLGKRCPSQAGRLTVQRVHQSQLDGEGPDNDVD
jgi:hypothetical protein